MSGPAANEAGSTAPQPDELMADALHKVPAKRKSGRVTAGVHTLRSHSDAEEVCRPQYPSSMLQCMIEFIN